MVEAIASWLRTFPGLEALQVNGVDPQPGSCGLYPRGVREVSCRETVLGKKICQYRQSFLLRLNRQGKEDAAKWLEEFQDWVNGQEDMAPELGAYSHVRAENGRLTAIAPSGLATYEAELIFTYQRER